MRADIKGPPSSYQRAGFSPAYRISPACLERPITVINAIPKLKLKLELLLPADITVLFLTNLLNLLSPEDV